MSATRHDQGGSVLIIAVIAMLILGILSFSFALLSRTEMTTGVNYKIQAQAESLAEAGLERGRDEVRSAASEGCGFTRWTDAAGSSSYGCGTGLVKLLFNGVGLGPGDYSAVIDNDCFPLVPAAIQDPSCPSGRDTNKTAVLTAWGTAATGQGRARVRAVLGVDNPWKHVCSNSIQDNPPGYCNEPANRNGNPSIVPADPNEYPGGPAAYDDLPRPQLGCSWVDVTLHGETAGNCPPGQNFSYPYPGGKRLVVQGDASKTNCGTYNGHTFSGYFDCALTTPCEAPACGTIRKACVPFGDPRLSDTSRYSAASPGGCGANTGMVFDANVVGNVNWNNHGDVGATGDGRNMYVMNGTFSIQKDQFHGVIVVEGDGGGSDDLQHRNQAKAFTEQNSTTYGRPVYGYPLAYLVYDPKLPPPTASPFAPQNTTADMGSASGTEIHGIIYSGGHVGFNPIIVDGGVVAFEIQTQSTSSAYTYNATYGNASPPPGFPEGGGNTVVLVRKSFIVCADYAADTSGGTACR